MKSLRSLTPDDHKILIQLIQGGTITGLAEEMKVPKTLLDGRMRSMRIFMECQTTFQLIALEVVYLMTAQESTQLNKLLGYEPEPTKTLAAIA